MKELFYTSPYKIRLHTIRIEYGEIGEKFVLKVFEGEINFKGDFEEKPIEAIFEEEEEMLMHLSSINSVLINGGWKLREKTDVLIKSFRALRFLSKNKYKIIIPLFFLPIVLPDQLIGIWTLLFVFLFFFIPTMLVILNINSRKIVREAKELKKEPEKILDEYLSRKNDQEYSDGDEDPSKSKNNDQDSNDGDENPSKSKN